MIQWQSFWALDIRNEELVNDGRDALRKLEKTFGMTRGIHRADYPRGDEFTWARSTRPPWGHSQEVRTVHKHRRWLRVLQRASVVVFAVLLVYGLVNLARELGGGPERAALRDAIRRAVAAEREGRPTGPLHRAECMRALADRRFCGCLEQYAKTVGFPDYIAIVTAEDQELSALGLGSAERHEVRRLRAVAKTCGLDSRSVAASPPI